MSFSSADTANFPSNLKTNRREIPPPLPQHLPATPANTHPSEMWRTITVHASEVGGYEAHDEQDTGIDDPIKREEKPKFWRKLKPISYREKHVGSEMIPVRVREAEYRLFFEKDRHGDYVDGVVEPEEGRPEWLRKRVEERKTWAAEHPQAFDGRSKSAKVYLPAGYGTNAAALGAFG